MKSTTLSQVQTGSSFWFGDVEFIKISETNPKVVTEMFMCQIKGKEAFVYISDCAWVHYDI